MFNKIKQLFSWLKQKWAWRGMATITKEDWQKSGGKKKLYKDLKNNPDMKQISNILTSKLWPPETQHPPYLYESTEELNNLSPEQIQEIIKELQNIITSKVDNNE